MGIGRRLGLAVTDCVSRSVSILGITGLKRRAMMMIGVRVWGWGWVAGLG